MNHCEFSPNSTLREYRYTLVVESSPTLSSMSHRNTLVAVNCPFISQLVAARNPRLLISRSLPVPGNPGTAIACALVGRSGYQVAVYCAVRNVCCLDIHGMYVGRSPATMKRDSSVHAVPPG